MSWTTLHMRVITPLFNGGADPTDAGVRVSSLRGATRFWFRALVGAAIGPSTADLAAAEGRVFGTTDQSSPVKLRIRNPPIAVTNTKPVWYNRHICYLLGQSLGDVREEKVIRPYIEAGTDFELQMRHTDEEAASMVLASLWLLCAYGGLGARTRRGFGTLRVMSVDGPLPQPWSEQLLKFKMKHYERLAYLAAPAELADATLTYPFHGAPHTLEAPRTLDLARDGWGDTTPTYPILGRRATTAGLAGGKDLTSWAKILTYAGEQLRKFRASVVVKPAVRPGAFEQRCTPEWREVVSKNESDLFGLGIFGLPVVFDKQYEVNADQGDGRDAQRLRRASPLWLRPVGGGENWRLLSFALNAEFLPDDVAVHLWDGGVQGRALRVPQDEVAARTQKWINERRRDGVPDPAPAPRRR